MGGIEKQLSKVDGQDEADEERKRGTRPNYHHSGGGIEEGQHHQDKEEESEKQDDKQVQTVNGEKRASAITGRLRPSEGPHGQEIIT